MTEITDTEVASAVDKKPVLEPEEIEALMASVDSDETIEALFSSLPPLHEPEDVESYAFEQGDSEGPGRYPLFVNLQERMAEALKEQWDDTFQRDIGVNFQSMKENTYRDVITSEEHRVFFAYSVEGYGRMMLAFDLPLIVAHVDAMLGGKGEVYGEDIQDLSPVESRLAERIAKSLEMHLEAAWQPVTVLDFVLFKLETDSQFLAVAGAEDACFSMYFDIQLDEQVKGTFALHYPRTFLEPMLESLRSTMSDEPAAVDEMWQSQLEQALSEVPLTMRLEMGQCTMEIGDFLKLSSGDYLPFKAADTDPSTLWIDSMPMFQAQAGSQDGMLAAELTDAIQGGLS